MKNTAIFALTFLIFTGCALRPTQTSPDSTPVTSEKKPQVTLPVEKTKALFHVIHPLGIKLVLLSVEMKIEEVVLMDKTLSLLGLKPGFWQITGFILDGKRYKIMNTSKLFVFQIKKNKTTYAGSYIIQCPKVNQDFVSEMKKMNFFNRYPFSSKQRLCELVVGSDFENVGRVWSELQNSQQDQLSLGF